MTDFDWTKDEHALRAVVTHFIHGLHHLAGENPDLLGDLIAGRSSLRWDRNGLDVLVPDDGEVVLPDGWSTP